MNTQDHIPSTGSASLRARLAPFGVVGPGSLQGGGAAVSRDAVPQGERRLRLSFINDLKLLFAALGAGGSVVPLGDNGRTTRLLSEYAATLQRQ
jgi:hypothetical protein